MPFKTFSYNSASLYQTQKLNNYLVVMFKHTMLKSDFVTTAVTSRLKTTFFKSFSAATY